MTDTVVLLHGIRRTSAFMRKFKKYLQTQGYITRNVDYPSTRYAIERLAEVVAAEVESAAESNRGGRIHLTRHSVGGLVIRAMLKNYRPSNLGRVVMIGTRGRMMSGRAEH
jgi:triacylglycerol esterase/lipase EstA (alpha/beta hydrolase family)